MHAVVRLALVALAVAACLVAPPALDAGPATPEEYAQRRFKVLLEAGKRHLDMGVWLRDQGMVPQATAEFVRAVEVSESRHPGAVKVLNLLEQVEDKFWKKQRKKPHSGLLDAYQKKVDRALKENQKDLLKLAEWGWKKSLEKLAMEEFLTILRAQDDALEFDDKGRIVIPAGDLPEDASAEIKVEAVTINGRLYVRDEFLRYLPDVTSIHQVESDLLRVRSMVSTEQAEDLLAIGEALVPQLAEEAGGRPTKRMNLFVFADEKSYVAYLDAAGLGGHKVAAGLALSSTFTALVNAGGRNEEAVRGIALHELAHLFMFGMSRCSMPSWYAEGFAETYGGTGTFAWQEGGLTLGGKMAAYRVDPLKASEGYIPLKILLGGSALALLSRDKEQAHRFYAESWALVRFLRTGAGDEIAERFELWETICRGKALGLKLGDPDAQNVAPSGLLFQDMFGDDYERLDADFKTFVGGL